MELQNGVQVPADLRLVFTKKLSINEAALTGEWLAVNKHTGFLPAGTAFAEQKNMAWMSTFVAEGYGQGVVVATGGRPICCSVLTAFSLPPVATNPSKPGTLSTPPRIAAFTSATVA